MKRQLLGLFLIFVTTMYVISCTKAKIDREQENRVDITEQINSLSERVSLEAYTPISDLVDGEFDDEDIIIYAGNNREGSNFEVDEFTQYDSNPSKETINKIITKHIPQLEKVRDNLKEPIIIRSAARSYEHEKKWGGQGTLNTSLTKD